VKNIVYQVKLNEHQLLKARIRDAVATVTPNMLQATWNIVWMFVVPPREPTLKLTEKVIYSEKLLYFLFVMV
jgi:hypothetical protein